MNIHNPNKISFIICVNNETYYEECLFYIERLHVPEGFTLEVFPMRRANSIYQGYNQAMKLQKLEWQECWEPGLFWKINISIRQGIAEMCWDVVRSKRSVMNWKRSAKYYGTGFRRTFL